MEGLRLPEINATIEDLGGYCPVQGGGKMGKYRFYFRSRWNKWTISIGEIDPVCKPVFIYSEPWGEEPGAAGYMSEEEAILMIIKGLEVFKQWNGEGAG